MSVDALIVCCLSVCSVCVLASGGPAVIQLLQPYSFCLLILNTQGPLPFPKTLHRHRLLFKRTETITKESQTSMTCFQALWQVINLHVLFSSLEVEHACTQPADSSWQPTHLFPICTMCVSSSRDAYTVTAIKDAIKDACTVSAGDSRAVLSRGDVAIPLTDDHKAAREDETVSIMTDVLVCITLRISA